MCDDKLHVMFSKKSDTREITIFMMVNIDKIREFLLKTEAIQAVKNIENLRKSHPNVTREGRNIGSN